MTQSDSEVLFRVSVVLESDDVVPHAPVSVREGDSVSRGRGQGTPTEGNSWRAGGGEETQTSARPLTPRDLPGRGKTYSKLPGSFVEE